MASARVRPREWLTDSSLSDQGRIARQEYTRYCEYLEDLGLLSYQIARSKYFLQSHHYWTLQEGFALPPHTVNINPNNICNLRCRHCDFGQKNVDTFYHKYNVVSPQEKIELRFDECKTIIDQVNWFKPIIRASFREPMLYRDILPLIDYAKGKGLPFWLLTNGFNLSKYAKDLAKLEVDSIRLSLDGPENLHDELRGMKNLYRRMIEGVKLILEEKERKALKTQIGFYFTINDKNFAQILQTAEQLESEGILSSVFLSFHWLLYTTSTMAKQHNETDAKICGAYVEESTAQSVDIYKMDLKEVNRQYLEIKERYPSPHYQIHFRPSFEYQDLLRYRDTEEFNVKDPRCKVLWYNLNINPAGDVKAFHHCLLPIVGNIHQSSVLDIWNGHVFREQRQLLAKHGSYRGCARCWGIYALLEDEKRRN